MLLPEGIATFLMTDVEGSTRLWEDHPEEMRAALSRHDALAEEIVVRHHGALIKERGEGDSLFIVFERADDAVQTACALQAAFHRELWPSHTPLHVRMALHTGEVLHRDRDYYGPTVNRCARLRSVAHGGQVLLSQATRSLVFEDLPEEISLRDLGRCRLKDLQRPEQIYQIVSSEWPCDFPPPASLERYRHNLPQQLTSFIGREQELEEVHQLLEQTRLLTLTGAGGCGKTRLALQAAAERVEEYPNGVWLVELAAHSDPERIPEAVAQVLEIPEDPAASLIDVLCEHLRESRLLLILDNCEHLVQECARTAHLLLRACPDLRILATSRTRLNVTGEITRRVPSLPTPSPDQPVLLQEVMQLPATRLFVERAVSIQPQFALTEANLAAVAQTCRRLDGIPLAIELAAARISVMSVEQIAARLDHSIRLLSARDSAAPKRHQTLRALMEWSYDLLTDPEKTLLRRLSVFSGGWTLEAAVAVCAEDDQDEMDVLDLLSRLVDASLVFVDPQEAEPRYRLQETVRQFAAECMAEEETGWTRTRHLAFFLALAEQAAVQLIGPNQREWLTRLDADQDNLRAALGRSAPAEEQMRLAGALWRYWAAHGQFSEGSDWLRQRLEEASQAAPAVRATACNGLGVLRMRQSDYIQAQHYLERSLTLRREMGDRHGIAETSFNLGQLYSYLGDYSTASRLYEEGWQGYHEVGDVRGEAACLNGLGMLTRDQGDLQAAHDYYAQSLEIFERLRDSGGRAITRLNLASTAHDMGDYMQARPLLEQCLDEFRSLGNRWVEAITLHNLAETNSKTQDYDRAENYYQQSLRLRNDLGDKSGVLITLRSLGNLAEMRGQLERATILFGAVRELQGSVGVSLSPLDQQEFNRYVERVRQELLPERFEVLWEQGLRMSIDDVLVYARQVGPV